MRFTDSSIGSWTADSHTEPLENIRTSSQQEHVTDLLV